MSTSNPPSSDITHEITAQQFRERLLNLLTIVIAVASIPIAVPNAVFAYRAVHPALAFIYIAIALITFLNAILRHFPYQIRVWVILILFYGLSFIAYTHSGLHGDGRIWLIVATTLAAMFLPPPHIIANLLIAAAMHFGTGFAVTHGIIEFHSVFGTKPFPFGVWFRDGLTLGGAILTIDAGIWFLLRSIENALAESQALSAALEHERIRLEQQSALLQKRLEQINTAAEINHALNAILDPDELIQTVVNLVQERFRLYYAGVFLLDERGEYAILRAGTGEAGKRMLAEGHRLAVGGSSMIGWAISNRKPRIALDVGEEAVRFANPHLPLTRTELALPLISRGEVLGAMTIQSDKPRAFDENDLKVLQTIADTLATALHNAYLFQRTQKTLEEMAAARRQVLSDLWANLPETLETTIGSIKGDGNSHPLHLTIEMYGYPMGEITLEKTSPWTDEEKDLARQAISQVALALENLQLLEEARRAAEAEQMISQISGEIAASLDLDSMLQNALRQLQTALGLTQAEITLTTPQGE